MDQAVAYSALAATVGLAVTRPRFTTRIRCTPGLAGLIGVAALVLSRLLTPRMVAEAARVQWRPLVTLASIMVITGVVREVGAFDRLAGRIERAARGRSAAAVFAQVFALSAATAALLNNDAAILILTPVVVALARRLYPGRPGLTVAFAFTVFLAPGIAPLIVSNPMNMIVAQYAGLAFNSYAAIMAPLSLVAAAVTYGALWWLYRGELATAGQPPEAAVTRQHRRSGERAAVLVMAAVFVAYPIAAALGIEIWWVAVAGAIASLGVCRAFRIAPVRKAATYVSGDILLFLSGMFLVVQGLESVGVTERLHALYSAWPAGGAGQLAAIGVTSALGSAVIDNHPMALLNMLAIDRAHGARPLLAALIGADLGPRLLPIGSLAGLLWMDLLRRSGVEVGVARFVRVGACVFVPAFAAALGLLWLIG